MDQNEARCLFAVESGSRAWGFESANSDYDVRFVYWKSRDWYLSIENHQDVIEEMGEDDLDFAGWDLRKALKLANKSNPSLHDWLATVEFYYRDDTFFEEFAGLCREYFDPNACYHHFRSMATTNFKDFSEASELPFKKYFYVFRALLCGRYIQEHLSPAPCLFSDLLNEFYPSGSTRDELEKLLELKKSGSEVSKTKQIPVLHKEIHRLFENTANEPPKRELLSTVKLNDFFRRVVLS